MVDFEIKDCYKFEDLLRIMEILRAPDGCMWDREQDHHSIRQLHRGDLRGSAKPSTTRTPSI